MTHTTDPPVNSARRDQHGTSLATAAPGFDWTRQLRTDLRSLVTFWLKTDNRVVSHVSIVPTSASGVR